MGSKIELAILTLYNETTDLLHSHLKVPKVRIEDFESWPLTFYRDYVSKNCPVLIQGAGNSFPAVKKWSSEYFMKTISEKEVTVAVTPNGYADGFNFINNKQYFVMPEEVNMKFKDFLILLEQPKKNYVCYIQKQNSNLSEDLLELLPDIGNEISWASTAFNKKPDAVNFWMGDERAVTSMHKDPYENIYCVIDGYKDFILIPPTDLPYVPYEEYPVRKYKNITCTNFEVEPESGNDNIMWISVDPLDRKTSLDKYPNFKKAHIYNVRFKRQIFHILPRKFLKPLGYIIPCSTILPKPAIVTLISQYDVEENIAQLMTLARIALERGDVERAEAILEMGIKICDEYQAYIAMPYIYDILASILIATGNIKKAENLLVQIIEKMLQLGVPENDSQIVDFKLRLARIYSSYDENELAEIGFKKCLVVQEAKILDGDTSTKTGMLYVNVLFWYGLHKIKSANYVKAKQLIDSAYNYSMKIRGLTPYQEMVILYTLADLNFQLEDYDIALQNIQSAILLGKGIGSLDLPRCYLKLGKIYIKLSSNDVAKHWLNEAYKLATLFNDSEVLEEVEIILSQLPEKKATCF